MENQTPLNIVDTLAHFAKFSGCRINLNKSEAVHIGKLKGSDFIPIDGQGLTWGKNTFKALGVVFSLNTKALYELNFVPKLGIIEQILNCWKHRSLSLLGKIAVVKSLLLPQLLYLFSVLCINLPNTFKKRLNSMLFKFIWSNGNDRVKRDFFV